MIRKYASLVLIGMIILAANLQTVSAQLRADNALQKVKTDVSKRGTGEKSKVVVKMNDGSTRKGFISQSGEDSFNLTDSKTKLPTTIAYRDVAQVKKQGWSSGAKIGLGVVIGVAAVAAVLGIAIRNADIGGNIRIAP